ncbi:MAG TPA: DNA polymerase I [Candidatus Saccharimonadales bacterium]|jgi:DNA polymerase-1|nr:DNA polymerase I [Candidatus Saccharimonadales bacterium]
MPSDSASQAVKLPPLPTNPKSDSKGRVFLLDTMSFIFRAYHAMARQRPMSTKIGIPTAATYVFVNMVRKLRADFDPEYLAAVFDVAGPTFRDEQAAAVTTVKKFDLKTQTFQDTAYHGYKAHRAEMPPDLVQQLPFIRRALEAYRIPILEQARFEADDVIGTLARKAAARSYPVLVVSSDKDMLQLVDEKVHVLNPTKDNLIYDAAKVEEVLGVKPEQVIDVMALRGDTVDNIPGAPGIGDKGSVDIIKKFGTLDAALERAAEVERKSYRESLQTNQEMILWSKQLVTIDQNVEIELDLEQMVAGEPDSEALRVLFTELEFTTLLKELVPTLELLHTEYREIGAEAELKELAKAPLLSIAVETAAAVAAENAENEEEETEEDDSGDAPMLPLGAPEEDLRPEPTASTTIRIALSAESGKAFVMPVDGGEFTDALKQLLEDPKIPKAVHDYKAALRELEARGVTLAGVRDEPLLYSYLINPTSTNHSLAEIALRGFNLKLSGSLAEAADVTGRLAPALRREVEAAGLMRLYDTMDLPLVPVLARMEEAGVKIDLSLLQELSARLGRECDNKAREIHEKAGETFNINSPKQLGKVLFEKLNLPRPVKHGKGKIISTAVDVLEELSSSHEVPRLVLEYRQLSKLKSTYVDALPQQVDALGRLHTTFNLAGTATGRLSSINPNLQNIPIRTEQGREIRAAFIPADGHVLLSADYSQIELRLLAHFSEDLLLVEAFRRGDDIHSLTASEVFGVPPMMIDAEHRRRAKAVNFGIVYGLSAFGLAQQLGIEQREAKRFIDAYFEKYKGVRRFIDRIHEETRQEQKVRTLFGRVRPIPDINSKNANMRGFAERTAVNTPLQGTAADLIKLAMIHLDEEMRERNLQSKMLLQVHDELLFEVPHAELETMRELVREKMENVHPLKVPLLVEVGTGPNWRDAK